MALDYLKKIDAKKIIRKIHQKILKSEILYCDNNKYLRPFFYGILV